MQNSLQEKDLSYVRVRQVAAREKMPADPAWRIYTHILKYIYGGMHGKHGFSRLQLNWLFFNMFLSLAWHNLKTNIGITQRTVDSVLETQRAVNGNVQRTEAFPLLTTVETCDKKFATHQQPNKSETAWSTQVSMKINTAGTDCSF